MLEGYASRAPHGRGERESLVLEYAEGVCLRMWRAEHEVWFQLGDTPERLERTAMWEAAAQRLEPEQLLALTPRSDPEVVRGPSVRELLPGSLVPLLTVAIGGTAAALTSRQLLRSGRFWPWDSVLPLVAVLTAGLVCGLFVLLSALARRLAADHFSRQRVDRARLLWGVERLTAGGTREGFLFVRAGQLVFEEAGDPDARLHLERVDRVTVRAAAGLYRGMILGRETLALYAAGELLLDCRLAGAERLLYELRRLLPEEAFPSRSP